MSPGFSKRLSGSWVRIWRDRTFLSKWISKQSFFLWHPVSGSPAKVPVCTAMCEQGSGRWRWKWTGGILFQGTKPEFFNFNLLFQYLVQFFFIKSLIWTGYFYRTHLRTKAGFLLLSRCEHNIISIPFFMKSRWSLPCIHSQDGEKGSLLNTTREEMRASVLQATRENPEERKKTITAWLIKKIYVNKTK